MQRAGEVGGSHVDRTAVAGDLLRVLIVDDSRDVVDSLALAFELGGLRVHKAYDGETALQTAPQLAPDVVILDLLLPDLDGYQVAQAFRSDSRCCNAFIIAYTGDATDAARARCAAAGIDLYVLKPVDPQELVRVITRHRASRHVAGSGPHGVQRAAE